MVITRRRLMLMLATLPAALSACGGGGSTSAGQTVGNIWSYIAGLQTINGTGVYGAVGTSTSATIPGARQQAACWSDAQGNLWLYGGSGLDAGGTRGLLGDLWMFGATSRQWTFVAGASTAGVRASATAPGAREGAATWRDASGGLWMFGGYGVDAQGTVGPLADLWKYDPVGGTWTQVGGHSLAGTAGVATTQGTQLATNWPGARSSAVAWLDAAGRAWVMGGNGADLAGHQGALADVWRFDPTSSQWTWVTGSGAAGAAGVYGTVGVTASSNAPGARYGAAAWTDAAGNVWVFGGYGMDASGAFGQLNDLWRYAPQSASWTWMAGASSILGHASDTGAITDVPGARAYAVAWADSSGNLWLFGGYGLDNSATAGYLNDTWRYATATGQWTLVSGSTTVDANGVYAATGTASGNIPGARNGACGWTDPSGAFWFFGGSGRDVNGNTGSLNDLWTYKP